MNMHLGTFERGMAAALDGTRWVLSPELEGEERLAVTALVDDVGGIVVEEGADYTVAKTAAAAATRCPPARFAVSPLWLEHAARTLRACGQAPPLDLCALYRPLPRKNPPRATKGLRFTLRKLEGGARAYATAAIAALGGTVVDESAGSSADIVVVAADEAPGGKAIVVRVAWLEECLRGWTRARYPQGPQEWPMAGDDVADDGKHDVEEDEVQEQSDGQLLLAAICDEYLVLCKTSTLSLKELRLRVEARLGAKGLKRMAPLHPPAWIRAAVAWLRDAPEGMAFLQGRRAATTAGAAPPDAARTMVDAVTRSARAEGGAPVAAALKRQPPPPRDDVSGPTAPTPKRPRQDGPARGQRGPASEPTAVVLVGFGQWEHLKLAEQVRRVAPAVEVTCATEDAAGLQRLALGSAHVVVSRRESWPDMPAPFLVACAAGSWVLEASFIHVSVAAESWADPTQHEVREGGDNETKTVGHVRLWLGAPRWHRERRDAGRPGIFAGVSAAILPGGTPEATQLEIMLRAGGGEAQVVDTVLGARRFLAGVPRAEIRGPLAGAYVVSGGDGGKPPVSPEEKGSRTTKGSRVTARWVSPRAFVDAVCMPCIDSEELNAPPVLLPG